MGGGGGCRKSAESEETGDTNASSLRNRFFSRSSSAALTGHAYHHGPCVGRWCSGNSSHRRQRCGGIQSRRGGYQDEYDDQGHCRYKIRCIMTRHAQFVFSTISAKKPVAGRPTTPRCVGPTTSICGMVGLCASIQCTFDAL